MTCFISIWISWRQIVQANIEHETQHHTHLHSASRKLIIWINYLITANYVRCVRLIQQRGDNIFRALFCSLSFVLLGLFGIKCVHYICVCEVSRCLREQRLYFDIENVRCTTKSGNCCKQFNFTLTVKSCIRLKVNESGWWKRRKTSPYHKYQSRDCIEMTIVCIRYAAKKKKYLFLVGWTKACRLDIFYPCHFHRFPCGWQCEHLIKLKMLRYRESAPTHYFLKTYYMFFCHSLIRLHFHWTRKTGILLPFYTPIFNLYFYILFFFFKKERNML